MRFYNFLLAVACDGVDLGRVLAVRAQMPERESRSQRGLAVFLRYF